MTPVVRVGNTVHRATGPWTPAVHGLLRHLESAGFDGAPRVLGLDAQGREVLTYIEGEVGNYPLADYVRSDETLADAARLLRRYHDATVGFKPAVEAVWQFAYPDTAEHEVICHNDFAPYNCVFVDQRLRAVIDFDTAGPGPRLWDVAYTAYRFVSLHADEPLTLSERARRLHLFCDEYGLGYRSELLDTIERRIAAIRTLILDRVAAGDPVFRCHLQGGHAEVYERDRTFVRRHRSELTADPG